VNSRSSRKGKRDFPADKESITDGLVLTVAASASVTGESDTLNLRASKPLI